MTVALPDRLPDFEEASVSAPIDPTTAKKILHAPGEVAFLDVREAGEFGEGHPLFAVPCPYSTLETEVPALLPRRTVKILVIDGGDGVGKRAARRLGELGYVDVSVVAGGMPAWTAAGLTLFKGVNVPTKTLGELAERAWHVRSIGAPEFARWQREGVPHLLFDTRPAAEHKKMAVPGGECVPNGELLHRLTAVAGDPDMPIVVHCAGRTRSLVGAAGLALGGVPNPVYALENGTQGWALAGLELVHGRDAPPMPELDAEAKQASLARARALAQGKKIEWIDAARVEALAGDPDRSLFAFDVRSIPEHAAGAPAGFVHALGGQLIQTTDRWVGVRRARIVLADDTGMRATLAAAWLRMIGYEVFVLPDIDRLPAGWGISRPSPAASEKLPEITATEAVTRCDKGEPLLDVRPSMEFRENHLAGARWAIRPRLGDLSAGRPVMLVGDAETTALAAKDLREMGVAEIVRVGGDPKAWRAAGMQVESTLDSPSDAEAIDYLFFVHDRHDGNLDAARRYLAWEHGLIAQLDAEERAEFAL